MPTPPLFPTIVQLADGSQLALRLHPTGSTKPFAAIVLGDPGGRVALLARERDGLRRLAAMATDAAEWLESLEDRSDCRASEPVNL